MKHLFLSIILELALLNVFAEEFDLEDLDSYGVDINGEFFMTGARFEGGILLNNEDYYENFIEQTRSDRVKVRGLIKAASEHVGRKADILVIAEYTRQDKLDDPSFRPISYMLGNKGAILRWDRTVVGLEAFKTNITLKESQLVEIYTGKFDFNGLLDIYFGYRLMNNEKDSGGEEGETELHNRDGTILASDEPLRTLITEEEE